MANTADCQYYLPVEVWTNILGFVDPRTLVFNCRLVCKSWKEIVESSEVWKLQILRNKIGNGIDHSVSSKAHLTYPWYICYGLCKNVFGKNIFPTYPAEGQPTYWRDEKSSSGGRIYTAPITSCLLGFSPIPEELIDEEVSSCFVSTVGVCSIDHIIDLYKHGFTRKIMEFRPPIVVSEWFAVRYNFVGIYQLDVTLMDSEWNCDYGSGQFKHTVRTQRSEWHHVTYAFVNYRPDVRYVRFHHGVDMFLPLSGRTYREFDHGGAAGKMAGAKLIITLPNLSRTT